MSLLFLAREHVFWVLACLPGVIGVCNHLISLRSAYATRSAIIRQYSELLERNTAKSTGSALDQVGAEQIDELRPKLSAAVLGAVCLTAVFAIGALLSTSPLGIGRPADHPTDHDRADRPATTHLPPEHSAAEHPTTEHTDAQTDRPATTPAEGPVALVYACYGAYVYTLLLVISRLNSAALSGKFLVNCAMRSSVALVFGFVAGEVGLFSVVTQANQRLLPYFALGVFPTWAFATLRRKMRTIFTADDDNCDDLPLCLIDGLDDGIVDRLAEVGIWDVQHLATARPGELTLRTLYPFNRVADWINQAILISYVKRRIGACRDMGIRSAIDLATLYADYTNQLYHRTDDTVYADRARKLFDNLAQKTNMSVEALLAVARSLYEDNLVQLIWTLWQSSGDRQERLDTAKAAVLETVNAAARELSIRFDPPPGWDAAVAPPLSTLPALLAAISTTLPQALRARGYAWQGTTEDLKALTRWDDVFVAVGDSLKKAP